ncbi:dual serine/threonine and tyrosine protein kinase isoform X2 [Carcharodon carcharias]|uniref:dual serine/threonine and tyrosine protein kinase isoform X2 n=1 Tax=Carcharodon carcharias TaxID=13397 RepID=UPI001B7F443B|nr:dual serine/threonine and tyrosine protein kinase isoform X2 [Carcharodon carcharias]
MEAAAGGGGSRSLSPAARELLRSLGSCSKHASYLRQNLRETKKYFRELRHPHGGSPGPQEGEQGLEGEGETGPGEADTRPGLLQGSLSCISFPQHEEEYLQATVGCFPCIMILGQNCGAKCHVLNSLLGEKLLPVAKSGNEKCKRRRLKFTHGKRTNISLALPGQYVLVHHLVAHQGKWDTIPEEDLEIQDSSQDPAHRAAHLEVTLHHPLLQEMEILVLPCHETGAEGGKLGDCWKHSLPIIVYAISEERLTDSEESELQEMREHALPVFFIKVPKHLSSLHPDSHSGPDKELSVKNSKSEKEKSCLYRQLTKLDYLGPTVVGLSNTSKAQSTLVEHFEKFRQLGIFAKQVVQMHLVDAATVLNGVHCRCLDIFINQAFDMQRDLQITPKRLEYTRDKENELFQSLMIIANRKQEEMRDMIIDTLNSMKEELLDEAANLQFKDIIISENGETVGNKDIKCCIKQIQELIISRLNQAVANKLISSVDYLRESFVGTLERCLKSLEKSNQDSAMNNVTSNHLKQILNAAYHVEVTFHSGSTVSRLLWEQIKQIIHRMPWVHPPAVTIEWKRKIAQDAIESLCASKLAKSICSQFRTRLNSSHEAFAASLRQLETGLSGRLEKTEDLWLKVRKDHAPRLARLSLESRSLRDLLLHGKPKLGRELGRGQYGVVYLCDSWAGHSPCALKSVVPPDDKHWNDLALEFHYTRSLPRHERLVDLHGSVIDYSYGGGSSIAVLLIMERLHRDLYAGLKVGLKLEVRLQIALDVVEGIRFLHCQGLVHRDIKLKNVLLDKQNRAKITDLGFCKPEAMMSGSIVGTPIHMAPELFSGKYDNSVDVYAFGILFWYLCTGTIKLPEAFEKCSSKDQLWNNVKKGARPERLPSFDEECWQLMEACWNGDPSQRPLLGIVQPILQSIMDRLCKSNSGPLCNDGST